MTHQFTEYSPVEYLKIDIASNYGKWKDKDLEKMNFEDRIAWFNEQEKEGNLVSLIKSADEAPLYFAGLQAYRDMLDGKPIGYPTSMDACSSGLQILAVLANCEKSAKRCGIINTGQREDAYTSLFVDMKEEANFVISARREDLKQAIMTSLYGSMAEPRKLFGEGSPALKLFYKIMETKIPGAWSLNLALKSLWQPWATEHEWVMPDGFEVSMTVEETMINVVQFFGESVEIYSKQAKGTPTGLSLSPNIVHSVDGMIVREMVRRCSYDTRQVRQVEDVCNIAMKRRDRRPSTKGQGRAKDKELRMLWERYLASGFLSTRVLDLIDENNISMVSAHIVMNKIKDLPLRSFPVLCVHDCFRAHPNYMNDLRWQYNQIMSELAASNILGDIATQITGRKQVFKKVGNISETIKEANYALS